MPNLRPHPRYQRGIVWHLGTTEVRACLRHEATGAIPHLMGSFPNEVFLPFPVRLCLVAYYGPTSFPNTGI
jgi:hypothetical protein